MSLDRGLLATGEWECMECGYIAAGAKTHRPKACPECGAPGPALEFFPYEDEEEDEPRWNETADEPDDLYEDLDPEEDEI